MHPPEPGARVPSSSSYVNMQSVLLMVARPVLKAIKNLDSVTNLFSYFEHHVHELTFIYTFSHKEAHCC